MQVYDFEKHRKIINAELKDIKIEGYEHMGPIKFPITQ